MIKKIFICSLIFVLICSSAIASTGTASTEVYVRSTKNGEVIGSLAKNDKVKVNKVDSKGWAQIEISGKEYKVWSEYLTISEEDSEYISSPRKSKSGGKTKKSSSEKTKKNSSSIKNKTTHKLKNNSELANIAGGLW